ncbi:hypothetical protein GEMRC1_011382 [Eukaryota sp. GEM-RC1]
MLMSGALICNSFMHSGSTIDTFLRMNLPWMGGSTFYAKFSASASLGAIHHGHRDKGRNVLSRFLPAEESLGQKLSDPYSLGGGCYGLGLVHCAKGAGSRDSVQFLRRALESVLGQSDQIAFHEPFIHGACLGLGLASFGVDDVLQCGLKSETNSTVELFKNCNV